MNFDNTAEILSLFRARAVTSNVFAAYYVSEIWYMGWVEKKSLHAKTRSVVIFDRVLNDEISRHNRGMNNG